MTRLSGSSILSLAGAVALLAGACSSSGGGSPGSGAGGSGSGAGGGTGTGNGFVGPALVPSATGFVSDPVVTGVVGAWYAYGDSAGPGANAAGTDFADSDCSKGGFTMSQCSQIVSPVPGQPFAPDPVNGMCTNGTAAKVLLGGTSGTADYSDLFGAGIGLDFNNPGGDAGAKGIFDMTPYTGVGFDFSGSVVPNGKMRVNFPFMGENHGKDSPYWKGATNPASPLTSPLHVKIYWADVGGPMYLTTQNPPTVPPAFDKTKVMSIQFQIFTNTSTATPYNFCVNNLTLLTTTD
jgi:hypothetical protein